MFPLCAGRSRPLVRCASVTLLLAAVGVLMVACVRRVARVSRKGPVPRQMPVEPAIPQPGRTK